MQTAMQQHVRGVGATRGDRARQLVHARRMTALALIAFATALSVVLLATLGLDIAPVVATSVVVAFPLMWWSAPVLRADEVYEV